MPEARSVRERSPARVSAAPWRRGRVASSPGGRRSASGDRGGRIGLTAGAPRTCEVSPNSVAVIDERSDNVVGAVGVGTRPGAIAFGSGSVWVANVDDQTVSRIDPTRLRTLHAFGRGPADGDRGERRAIWVAQSDPTAARVSVTRIDPSSTPRAGRADRERRPGEAGRGRRAGRTRSGSRRPPGCSRALTRRPAARSRRSIRTLARRRSRSATAPSGSPTTRPTTSRASTRPGCTTPIAVGNGPTGIAVGEGGVWVADSLDNTVSADRPGSRSGDGHDPGRALARPGSRSAPARSGSPTAATAP